MFSAVILFSQVLWCNHFFPGKDWYAVRKKKRRNVSKGSDNRNLIGSFAATNARSFTISLDCCKIGMNSRLNFNLLQCQDRNRYSNYIYLSISSNYMFVKDTPSKNLLTIVILRSIILQLRERERERNFYEFLAGRQLNDLKVFVSAVSNQ